MMMSEMIERTLASVPNIITGASSKDGGASKAFQHFVKLIGSCQTKREEIQVVQKEISLQKQKLAQPSMTGVQKRESLVRLVYCNMLGHDVSFAYIHAIKLAEQGTIVDKRVGYLTCCLFLPGNDLVMMLTNTIQKDLKSTNILDMCTALAAAATLVTPEMMPAIIPFLEAKITHSREAVRKKAVICLHQFWRKAPDLVQHQLCLLPRVLSDRDPSVVWAAIHLYHDLIKVNPTPYKKLVLAFVGILEQIISRKLPKDYEYHTVPAPWMTVVLLKILAKQGAGDQGASEQMYLIIKEVMQRTEPSHKMGLAVIYECLETIATIYPHPGMIQHASHCTGRFLAASNLNLKYLGLIALTSIVKVAPQYATDHQDEVMRCLDHADDSIRRKTLELLYRMANRQNVQAISAKLLENMTSATDQYLKMDIIHKVTDMVERFSENFEWYVNTTNNVLVFSGDAAPKDAYESVISTIRKNTAGQLERYVFVNNAYSELMRKPYLPEVLVKVAVWVVGEYCVKCPDTSLTESAKLILLWCAKCTDDSTKAWIMQALIKICCKVNKASDLSVIYNLLPTDTTIFDRETIQRLNELKNLCQVKLKDDTPEIALKDLTDEKFDFTLSFLDEYVSAALEKGGKVYQPYPPRQPQPDARKDTNKLFSGLYYSPNEAHLAASTVSESTGSGERPASKAPSAGSLYSGGSLDFEGIPKLKPQHRVWTREGVIEDEKTPLDKLDAAADISRLSGEAGDAGSFSAVADREADDAEAEKSKLLASALFSGLLASGTTGGGSVDSSLKEALSDQKSSEAGFVDDRFPPAEEPTTSPAVHSGGFSLPFDEHQRLSASAVGLLSAGDFTSPCEEPSMYGAAFQMDDFTDPGYVSVNARPLTPGAAAPEQGFWRMSHLEPNSGEGSVSSSCESRDQRTTESLMSISDPITRGQHLLNDEDTCTTETITEPSDSLENLSAACGSDVDDAPPLEFHNDSAPNTVKLNQYALQRTISSQSHDKLIVYESEILHIEAVKRALPNNLELVLWITVLTKDHIDSSNAMGLDLRVISPSCLHMEIPDSNQEEDRFRFPSLYLENSNSVPVTILLQAGPQLSEFPEVLRLRLTLPDVAGDDIDTQVPITPFDFIRPLEKNLSEFSQLWPTVSGECKVNLPNTSSQEVDGWTLLIAELAHFCVIQIQDEESLLCGEWLSGSGDRLLLLLHCRVQPDMVHLWVKSDSDSLLQMISSCLASLG